MTFKVKERVDHLTYNYESLLNVNYFSLATELPVY